MVISKWSSKETHTFFLKTNNESNDLVSQENENKKNANN